MGSEKIEIWRSGIRLLSAWTLATRTTTAFWTATLRSATATTLHRFLALLFIKLAVSILVILLDEFRPASAYGFLALVFIKLAIAVLVKLLKHFLWDLTGSTAALATTFAFALASLTALGAWRFLSVGVLFGEGRH